MSSHVTGGATNGCLGGHQCRCHLASATIQPPIVNRLQSGGRSAEESLLTKLVVQSGLVGVTLTTTADQAYSDHHLPPYK